MALRNKERQPDKKGVACSRCGAEIISTNRSDTPLCLICRAVILALNFQAAERETTGPSGIVASRPGGNILSGDLSEGPDDRERRIMKRDGERGKVGYIILWFLGVPFSVLLLIALLRSC